MAQKGTRDKVEARSVSLDIEGLAASPTVAEPEVSAPAQVRFVNVSEAPEYVPLANGAFIRLAPRETSEVRLLSEVTDATRRLEHNQRILIQNL